METNSLKQNLDRSLAISKDEWIGNPARLAAAYQMFNSDSDQVIRGLAMEASLNFIQHDVMARNLATTLAQLQPTFSKESVRLALATEQHLREVSLSPKLAEEIVRVAVEQQFGNLREASRASEACFRLAVGDQRCWAEYAAEINETFASQARYAALALQSNIAESAMGWHDVINANRGFECHLDGPGFLKSLEAIQAELTSVATLACDSGVLARSIALAAMDNVEAFQRVNSDVLKAALNGVQLAANFADLPVAADYVVQYNDFARLTALGPNYLAPQPPSDTEEYCREEIGPRLHCQLEKLDPRLAQLRREAWQNIGKKSPSTSRLAAHGLREVFSEVLRTLAPDEAVRGSAVWESRQDRELARPTRHMRLEYLLGGRPERLAAVKQFAGSLEKAHKFAHTFPEDTELVRAYLAEVETCVYLLLTYTEPGKR